MIVTYAIRTILLRIDVPRLPYDRVERARGSDNQPYRLFDATWRISLQLGLAASEFGPAVG
jgi:hypothetical protein